MARREYLGEFEQIVLLAIVRLADEAYGVPIRLEIERRTGRALTVGALYSTLDRLQDLADVQALLELDPSLAGELNAAERSVLDRLPK